jgi:antitoxin HigA-1
MRLGSILCDLGAWRFREESASMTEPVVKRPVYPIHPGEILADELEALDMTAAELARELHVPSNRLYQLIAGKRAMTADTALRLEQWLGVEAAFWMNLQKSYELDLAKEQIGDEIKRTIRRRQPAELAAPV